MPNEFVSVVLDSAKRTSGSEENFSITLIRPINNVKHIKITDINLPLSYYNINVNNNTLHFYHPFSTDFNVVIPVGNYTGETLAIALATGMNTAPNLGGFTVTFDVNTFKFTFSNAALFRLRGPTGISTSTLWSYLGFSTEAVADALTVTSNEVANLSSPRYIKIKSNILGAPHQRIYQTQFGNNSSGGIEDNTILTVFPDSNFGCTLVQSNLDKNIRYVHSFKITNIDLFLTDEDDQAIILNGNSWVLALILTVR